LSEKRKSERREIVKREERKTLKGVAIFQFLDFLFLFPAFHFFNFPLFFHL